PPFGDLGSGPLGGIDGVHFEYDVVVVVHEAEGEDLGGERSREALRLSAQPLLANQKLFVGLGVGVKEESLTDTAVGAVVDSRSVSQDDSATVFSHGVTVSKEPR